MLSSGRFHSPPFVSRRGLSHHHTNQRLSLRSGAFLKPALGHERGAPVIEQQHPVLDLCLNLHRMWPCSSPSSFLFSLFSLLVRVALTLRSLPLHLPPLCRLAEFLNLIRSLWRIPVGLGSSNIIPVPYKSTSLPHLTFSLSLSTSVPERSLSDNTLYDDIIRRSD